MSRVRGSCTAAASSRAFSIGGAGATGPTAGGTLVRHSALATFCAMPLSVTVKSGARRFETGAPSLSVTIASRRIVRGTGPGSAERGINCWLRGRGLLLASVTVQLNAERNNSTQNRSDDS